MADGDAPPCKLHTAANFLMKWSAVLAAAIFLVMALNWVLPLPDGATALIGIFTVFAFLFGLPTLASTFGLGLVSKGLALLTC
jgi:ABC-type Co2+ transport system permease subunit